MKKLIVILLVALLASSCAKKIVMTKEQEKYDPDDIVFTVSEELDSLIACNPLGKKEVLPENVEGEVVIDWTKYDEDCMAECRYWRAIRFKPNNNICIQIVYNTGKIDI